MGWFELRRNVGNVNSLSGCQFFRARVKAQIDSRHFFADKTLGRFRLNWCGSVVFGRDWLLNVAASCSLEPVKRAVLGLIISVDDAEHFMMLCCLYRIELI